jgi:hypothetical protein
VEALLVAINIAVDTTIVAAQVPNTTQITIRQLNGGDIKFVDGTNTPLSKLFEPPVPGTTPNKSITENYYLSEPSQANNYVASLWTALADSKIGGFAIAQPDAPSTIARDGQLWYNSIVDILVNDGAIWKGYRNADLGSGVGTTDIEGPIVSATAPLKQSNGNTSLANGDLWISTADLENFPQIYKWSTNSSTWILIDNADQTTESGVVFHDARWAVNGGIDNAQTNSTIAELLVSNFVDFDAPDPALYPKGMLLWNLRRSGFNVKKFVTNYVDTLEHNPRFNDESMSAYYAHRWISEAANQENGAGTFGRNAQRAVVLQSLVSLINGNQQIRDTDRRIFNLILKLSNQLLLLIMIVVYLHLL